MPVTGPSPVQFRDLRFDAERGTFTRSYGSHDVDAALLILPLIEIEPADSARVRGTIGAVRRTLGAGGPRGDDG